MSSVYPRKVNVLSFIPRQVGIDFMNFRENRVLLQKTKSGSISR